MNNELAKKTWSDSSMLAVTDKILFQSDQSFSYQIDKDHSGNYTVTSTGIVGPATKRVYATMGFKGLFDSAILVKDRISLMPNTLVAGYNSEDATDTDFDVEITLYPSAEMRGAIVGKNVTFKSGGTFYYDEALRDNVSIDDVGARFIVKRWRED